MVNDGAISLEKHLAGQNNRSGVDGNDWCSDRRGKIESLMLALYLPVKNALGTEHTRDRHADGWLKISLPRPLRAAFGKDFLLDFFVGRNFSQFAGIGFGKL